jgi:histidinol-phosphatase (PHP family)
VVTRLAVAQGYDVIELDPSFTKDGVCVLYHDKTLTRTCRTSDGGKVQGDLLLADTSYADLLTYDVGLSHSLKYRGERVPTLAETLAFANEQEVLIKLDNRMEKYTPEQLEVYFTIIEESGARVAFTCKTTAFAEKVIARFPDAEIHYDGEVTEETVAYLKTKLRNNSYTVWLYHADAAKETCEMIHRYAELGLWIVSTEEELAHAKELGADIIETPGELKPPREHVGFVDSHIHTKYSHDSTCEPLAHCAAAAERGLVGLCITDHCDLEYAYKMDVVTPIVESVNEATACNKAHSGKLAVYTGVEYSEAIWDMETYGKMISAAAYDVVLGSIHAVKYKDYTVPYSHIDFSAMTTEDVRGYLHAYFREMKEMMCRCDMDVLTHLTCPLRYIVGKYGVAVDMSEYDGEIEEILRLAIEKHLALEINTSGIGSFYGEYMPYESILRTYRAMGGYLITLASDAHTADRVGNGFAEAARMLKSIGFTNAYYYKQRMPIPYAL